MKHSVYTIPLLCLLWTILSCQSEHTPLNLPPDVRIEAAQDITRTSARLQGEITPAGEGQVSRIQFRYGVTTEAENTITCQPDELRPSILLSGLNPGTTYHYRLEAGSEHELIASDTRTFSTLPNDPPAVGELRMLCQGPLSITLEYDITDNGGEAIISTGFYYTANGGTEQCLRIDNPDEPPYRARLDGLQPDTDYQIQAFASNSVGESRGKTYTFRTRQAVVVTQAGMLQQALSEEEKYLFTELSIAGPLNGTDLRLLRDMMGKDTEGNNTPGQLETLDLTDATIVAGGDSYDGHHYTTLHTVGSGLFAECSHLKRLILPDDTETVEKDAFENCVALHFLQLSSALTTFTPSAGCTNLAEISVPASSNRFTCDDGVLYDKELTTLMWYPEGKTDESYDAPATIKAIGDYACRYIQADEIRLPEGLQSIGASAFYGSYIRNIDLPHTVTLLPNGCFQQCRRLTSISLGTGMRYLSEYCFDGCTALRHFYVHATEFPPFCQEETFAGTGELLQQGTLHVPTGSLSLYRNHREWGKFQIIVDDLTE